jgi:hypothetical protein
MAIKTSKIKIKLNDGPTVETVTIEIQLDSDLKVLIDQIRKDRAKDCACERCGAAVPGHFWVNMVCLALQDTIEDYVAYSLKHKFHGNTKIVSNAVN